MGMYTALHFAAELKKDTPEEVIGVLKLMAEAKVPFSDPENLPDHEFFRTERWRRLFTMDSYYHRADTHCSFRFDDISQAYYLTVTSNIKNYDSEIEKFINWIEPYLEASEGDFLGYSRYEETEQPTLIYHRPKAAQTLTTQDN